MTRKLLAVAAFAAFAALPSSAHAQMHFGVAAGLSSPTSDLGKLVDAGYHATGILAFSAPLAPVGLRVEGSFNEFNYKSPAPSDAKYRVASGTVNGTFSAPGMMGIYAIAGLGMYKPSCTGVTTCATDAKVGFNVGAGYQMGLAGFSAFLEARYHSFSANGNTFNFIPVSFGILF